MKRKLNSLIFILGLSVFAYSQNDNYIIGFNSSGETGPFNISGKVIDRDSRDPIIGVNIFIEALGKGESADLDGKFNLELPRGIYNVRITSVGYITQEFTIEVRGKGPLNIRLEQDINQLDEIVVTGVDPDANIRATTSGVEKLSIESIVSLPPFAGEVDILKSLTLLPGVNSGGEASAGFNVRGGGYDQNLILLGGTPIYNPSHLFGFFSAFNADMVNDVVLYKGGIPANFGGRASSILDLSYKKGDMQSWGGNASLGTISAKMSLSGPIIKNKLSILATGRVSYANYMLGLINDDDISNSAAQFYDGSAIVNYQISENSNIDFTTYYSSDGFNLASDTTFSWSNFANTLTWNHAFTEKLFLKASINSSQYKFTILDHAVFSGFNLKSEIRDNGGNFELKYLPKDDHKIIVGVQSKYLAIEPGSLTPGSAESSINTLLVPAEQALESGVYFQHDWDILEWLGISYGLRYADYRYLGPKTIHSYDIRFPKSRERVTESIDFTSNELIKTYNAFEPRISLRLNLSEHTSLKFGYNRMNQFIHLLSNTGTIAPTDVWKLSDQYVSPQAATQYSAGIFRNFANNTIETSIEAYYKSLDNVLEYKDGAKLILNPYIESDLLTGAGEAYGVEFYVKKKSDPLSGWFSYTYSRSLRQVIGSYPVETINKGLPYPSNYDKPHDLTAVMEYRFNDLLKYSAIFNYSTGRPVTYPSAKFAHLGEDVAYYDTRNQHRILDYHRLDMSLTFNFNTKYNWIDGDWVLSVYNIYARKNAFSIFFSDSAGAPPRAYKLSVLGIALPSLSYKVNF